MLESIEEYIEGYKAQKNAMRRVANYNFQILKPQGRPLSLPLFESRVAAGSAFPVEDRIEDTMDLNAHLIHRPKATFFVRASGDSMIQAGINDADILVVDRSIEAKNGNIVIAVVNGEMTVKRLRLEKQGVILQPENPKYAPLIITEDMDFRIWGVVTSVIHEFKGRA